MKYKNCKIKIRRDPDPIAPSDWADMDSCFLIAWDPRNFYVEPPGSGWGPDSQYWLANIRRTHRVHFFNAYIHSGIYLTMGTPCNWDTSHGIGVVCIPKEWEDQNDSETIDSVLNEWNQYLSGDVWYFVVTGPDGEEESCGGFYGQEYCMKEAKSIADHMALEPYMAQVKEHWG